MHPTHNRSVPPPAAAATVPTDDGRLTPTCQNRATETAATPDAFTASGLVAALENCWSAIRARHRQVPDAVIVVGTGSPAKPGQPLKWGHFASLSWQTDTRTMPEVLISGEGLARTPGEIFTTLLHEAAHGLADTRGIQDTSRQGRWHNKRFARLADELGMDTVKHDRYGFSPCILRPATAAEYRPVIDCLAAALGAWRHPDTLDSPKQRTSSNNGVVCQCACPRKIRLSTAVHEAGQIVCAVCNTPFTNPDTHTPDITTGTDSGKENPPMRARDYDPTGDHHAGTPTYPYKFAPKGLATRRQLHAMGLRPGQQTIAAQIVWRNGKRVAYLYDVTLAKPKRPATPAQLAALDKAMRVRRTCTTCGAEKPYVIPRRYGECLDCTHAGIASWDALDERAAADDVPDRA